MTTKLPVTQGADVNAGLWPVWAAVVAERGVLCPVCQKRWPSQVSLLTHRTAAGHWRRGR